MPVSTARSKALASLALALALVLVWTTCRVLPARNAVFPDGGGTVLLGNDPWFHLHHARAAAERFPEVHRWDIGTGYPRGNRAGAAGLFNLGVATAALLLDGGGGSRETILAVLAWSPILLGAVSLLLLAGLARELGGNRLALVALALRVAFPGEELERTLLGFGDYHAAEIALATWGLWAFARFAKQVETSARPGRLALSALGAALPFALFLFVWFGAPLHVATLIAAFWGAVLLGLRRGGGPLPPLPRFWPCFLAILAMVAVAGLAFPSLVMAPAGFRQTLAALGVQALLLATLGRALPSLPERWGRGSTIAICLGLAVLLPVAAALAWPRAGDQLLALFEPRDPLVSEHLSVDAALWLSYYGLILPWIALGGLSCLRRGAGFDERLVLLYLAAWTLLWQLSGDFGYLAGALLPLVGAIGMLRFAEFAGAVGGRARTLRLALPAGAFAASLLLALPLGLVRTPWRSLDEVEEMLLATPGWTEAMAWLREETPQPTLPTTHRAEAWPRRAGFSYPPGAYAVLSHWQFGNLVCALGERIAVAARSYHTAFFEWFLESEEAASHERLEAKGEVRYVILDALSVCDSFVSGALQAGLPIDDFQVVEDRVEVGGVGYPVVSFGEAFRGSVGARLYLGEGSGMERYRLVHESAELRFVRYRLIPELEAAVLRSTRIEDEATYEALLPLTEPGASWMEEDGDYFCYSGQIVAAVKIYERVAGARLVGSAIPGEEVALELELRSRGTGRSFFYRQRTQADGEGRVEFRVPYPTEASEGEGVVATSAYRLRRGDGSGVEARVGAEQVRSGALVPLQKIK
jgi:asparagine N-glycosylation enzyme membrane subunit Stt3